MPALQYDPDRLGPLRVAAADAYRHLVTAHSPDPAAASAQRVLALVRANIEHGWLPAIDRLIASDAMLSWTTGGPTWARGLTGDALGEALAAHATELLTFATAEDYAELVATLRRHADDEDAMATFFATLGAAGLLDLVVSTATGEPDRIDVPLRLRDAFAAAAHAGVLPAGYGRQLVRAARTENERAGGMGDGGLALSFLFHGRDLPGAIVIEAVDEAILQEHAFAAGVGGGPDIGAALWQGTGTNAARSLWQDFDEPYRGDDLDAVDAQDPMYALLGQLAREQNGDAGRAVFADADRARYLFAERDVLADGGRAIVAAAATAAAGRDVVATATSRLLDDASLVASAFVNLFGPAHADDVGEHDRATAGAARVVGVHMYGVQHAMGVDSTVTDGDRMGALPDDRRGHVSRGRSGGGIAELANAAFPASRSAAVFDPAALAHILHLAARTDAGIEALRGGLSVYQQAIAAEVAGRVASGAIPTAELAAFLDEVMGDSARLEGAVVAHVGNEAERRGRDLDGLVSFWVSSIGQGIGLGAKVFGPGASAVVGAAADAAGHALGRSLADAEDDAADRHDGWADLAAERLAYLWIRELHAAGLLDAELAPGILVDGALPPYDDLVGWLLEEGPPGWEVTTVLQQFDESRGGVVDSDLGAVLDAMRVAQGRFFDERG